MVSVFLPTSETIRRKPSRRSDLPRDRRWGVSGGKCEIKAGDLVTLSAGVPHTLRTGGDSLFALTTFATLEFEAVAGLERLNRAPLLRTLYPGSTK